jgi:hypothetical protein
MIHFTEGFTFATALDLTMGYYHITLDVDAQKLCTIIFPWGKNAYKCLPMGIKIAPDVSKYHVQANPRYGICQTYLAF